MQWFRLYHRIVDDDKLRLLAFEDRWHFVALCCLKASGLLDQPESELRDRQVAVKLGVQVRELEEIARRLREVNLIAPDLTPLAWDELQFRSDNSTERVRNFREKQQRNAAKRQRNVSETGQETDTETDKENVEPNGSTTRAKAHKMPMDWSPKALPPKVAALVAQWPDGRLDREIDNVRDYWTSRERDSKRSDWDKVLHNRIRDIHDRVMRDSRNGNTNPTGGSGGPDKRSGLARAIDRELERLSALSEMPEALAGDDAEARWGRDGW